MFHLHLEREGQPGRQSERWIGVCNCPECSFYAVCLTPPVLPQKEE